MDTKENNLSATSVRRSSAYQIANAQKEQKLSMSLSARNNEQLYLDGYSFTTFAFHDTNCDFLFALPTSTHS